MSATLLAKLIEAGTPAALVAEVALELGRATAAAEALEQRRSNERTRKAKQRSRDVTGQDVTDGDSRDVGFPDKEKSPTPPKEINPSHVCETREGRFHRMPEGWRPSKPLPTPLQAKIDLWPPGAFEDEVAALKRWAANAENKNGKGKKLDWDKALWTWLGRRHDERYSRQPANNNGSKTAAALDILARLDSASHAQAGRG